jgi:N6-L-threonylcarbamoyladenine synthase
VKVLLRELGYEESVPEEIKKDIAASFQASVVDVLIEKVKLAVASEKNRESCNNWRCCSK